VVARTIKVRDLYECGAYDTPVSTLSYHCWS